MGRILLMNTDENLLQVQPFGPNADENHSTKSPLECKLTLTFSGVFFPPSLEQKNPPQKH